MPISTCKTDVLIPMIEALGSETEIRYETVENRGVETIVGDEVDTAFLEKVYSTSLLNEPKKLRLSLLLNTEHHID